MQKTILTMIESGDDKFPLTNALKQGNRYYSDFVEMIDFFSEKLSTTDYKSIEKKIISSCHLDEQAYLQCMRELTVLYYALRRYGEQSFRYEPQYNGHYNPECAFVFNGKTINIEVKCPNMEKRIALESHNSLKIFSAERIPEHNEVINEIKGMISTNIIDAGYSMIEEVPRMDNKLKDF